MRLFYLYRKLLLLLVIATLSSLPYVSSFQQQYHHHHHGAVSTTTFYPRSSSNLKERKIISYMSSNDNNNDNLIQKGSNFLQKLPGGSILLLLIGLRSLFQLFDEVPDLLSDDPNLIGTAFDVFFVVYTAQNILQQTGLVQEQFSGEDIEGTECCVTLNVGREKGTLMERNWAASGNRLLLPINIRFTEEDVDLGFPGEEALGGRYCKKVVVLNNNSEATFVGPKGESAVPVVNGGWISTGEENESKLRFFLDFPNGAFRNDVIIPPRGRVFFSGVCFTDRSSAKLEAGEVIFSTASDSKAGILQDGALTMKKKNGVRNLFGALGNINLFIGKYTIGSIKTQLL
mmetsp:Transcript_14775/g.16934  ORF Transcript_14775/g.16934 Transcript_14775/m.16934 type:complete len:344 (-) Transcript_14775:103-1134(-)